jgi:hypothetical protein
MPSVINFVLPYIREGVGALTRTCVIRVGKSMDEFTLDTISQGKWSGR